MSGPRAFITGITGQDGSYLAEFLLSKGYKVYGLVRRSSTTSTSRIAHILDRITLICGDVLDIPSLVYAMSVAQPDEVYHLAAQSHVGESFKQPVATFHYNAVGTINMLEACPKEAKFYQAGTSEMFGNSSNFEEPYTFHPRSPYAISKVAAHHATVNYREAYGLFACNGILFNHESPRRSQEFVTRKITRAVARIKIGLQYWLELGNIETMRDWGYAPEYVQAMWMMLQHEQPGDYIVATGKAHSVREFVRLAFEVVGLDWQKHVTPCHEEFIRPSDVEYLCGDASKAKSILGWEPKIGFETLVQLMVESDLKQEREKLS